MPIIGSTLAMWAYTLSITIYGTCIYIKEGICVFRNHVRGEIKSHFPTSFRANYN